MSSEENYEDTNNNNVARIVERRWPLSGNASRVVGGSEGGDIECGFDE